MVLLEEVWPEIILSLLTGMFKVDAINFSTARLAFPVSGGAFTFIFNASPSHSPILSLEEFGTTFSFNLIIYPSAAFNTNERLL